MCYLPRMSAHVHTFPQRIHNRLTKLLKVRIVQNGDHRRKDKRIDDRGYTDPNERGQGRDLLCRSILVQ